MSSRKAPKRRANGFPSSSYNGAAFSSSQVPPDSAQAGSLGRSMLAGLMRTQSNAMQSEDEISDDQDEAGVAAQQDVEVVMACTYSNNHLGVACYDRLKNTVSRHFDLVVALSLAARSCVSMLGGCRRHCLFDALTASLVLVGRQKCSRAAAALHADGRLCQDRI
jgi:hypothetical protein